MKHLAFKLILFVLLPGVLIDGFLRIAMPFASTKGYGRVLRDPNPKKINFLFVGSSRVGAAIDADTFDKTISPVGINETRSENLGMGSSTLIGHYYGLKSIFAASLQDVHKCHVFVEATLGLPPMDTWEGAWFHSGQQEQLYPYITFADYVKFWRISGNSTKEKLTLGLLKTFRLAGFVQSARSALLSRGEGFTQKYISLIVEKLGQDTGRQSQATMHMAAGIRNDPAGIRIAREIVLKDVSKAKSNQSSPLPPFTNWQKLILLDLKHLAEINQCKISLFHMPMSPSQERAKINSRSKEQLESFSAWAQQNSLSMTSTGLQFTDGDYPDLWHLGADKALIFTKHLAQAYLVQGNRSNRNTSVNSIQK